MVSCILLRTACEADLHTDDSFNELIQYPVWPLPETAMGVLRDTIIPLVRSKDSPARTNDLTRPPAVINRQKEKKKRYPRGGGGRACPWWVEGVYGREDVDAHLVRI